MSGISLREWLYESKKRIRDRGRRGLLQSIYYAYAGAVLQAETSITIGTNVFDYQWDLLIILDACRVDALTEVATEYDFIEGVDSIRSVGSTSPEWQALTFRRKYSDEIGRTAYVTANPQLEKVFGDYGEPPYVAAAPFGPSMNSYDVVSPDIFDSLDKIFKYATDDELGVVKPRTVTDRAIEHGRTHNPDRCMVHYMQPHTPYLGVDDPPEDVFDKLREGDLSRQRVWEMYLETLRTTLDEVQLLIENYDAEKVVITADHGEGFGEWSFYSHNVACPHPVVRRVPWVETTARDERSFDPKVDPDHGVDSDVEEQLRRLGYR